MTEPDDGSPDETSAPPPAATPPNPGTVLIPEGHTHLPDELRPKPAAPEPVVDFPRFDAFPTEEGTSPVHPSFPPASTPPSEWMSTPPTSQPPTSLPPTAATSSWPPAGPGTSSAPSWPALEQGNGPGLDTDARRLAIEQRFRRRRLLLLGVAVGLAAVLVGAALFVIAQRGDDAKSGEQQVLAVHADALTSIMDANEPVLSSLADLARQDLPDLSQLAAPATTAKGALADLPIPASEGDQAHLGQNLSAAISAEVAFLDDLLALSGVAVEDVSSIDLDNLSSDAQTLTSALYTAYGDQPSLSVPGEVDELAQRVDALISTIGSASDIARERAGLIGDLEDYEAAVRDVLADLESARDTYEAAAPGRKTIATNAEYLAATSAVDQAISAREALAARLDDITPLDGLENAHARIADGLRGLADSLYNVKQAIGDVDCRNPYDYDPPPECNLVNTSSYFVEFTEESTAAGHDLDAAVATWEAELDQLREDLA